MKKSKTIVLVMMTVFFVAGNVSAAEITLTNGDFETGAAAWVKAPVGWTNWADGAGWVIPLAFAGCPDGGAKALLYSAPATGSRSLTFAQLTTDVIESGKTYTLVTNMGSHTYYTGYATPLPSVTAVIYALNPVNLDSANLAVISMKDADFSADHQWNAYSASYVANNQYAGWNIGVYMTFAGNNYGPIVDSVRLYETERNLVISPSKFVAFENPLSGSNQAGYTLVLDAAPDSDVTVNMVSSESETTLLPSSLTFTSANWDVPQSVTATVGNKVNSTITRTVNITNTTTSSDPDFDNLPAVVAEITVYNDDVANVFINSGDGIVVDEQGQTSDTYTIQLLSEPSDDVYISPIAGDPNAITITPSSVVFISSQWYQIKTVTVTAIDDDIQQFGDHSSSIIHLIDTWDEDYEVVTIAPVYVTIRDNDCGAWGYPYGDINKDCRVNLQDFAIFAADWAQCAMPHDPDCINLK